MYGWIGSRESTRKERKTGTDSGGYTCFVEDEASFVMLGKPFGLT